MGDKKGQGTEKTSSRAGAPNEVQRRRLATLSPDSVQLAPMPPPSWTPLFWTLGSIPFLCVIGRMYLCCRHGYKAERHTDPHSPLPRFPVDPNSPRERAIEVFEPD